MKRRGFVLIAVLVVIGASVLVATGLLFIVQGRAVDAAAGAETAQTRSLAWSGLQIIMAEFDGQRDRVLQGDLPQLRRDYTVYETHNRRGVIRLLPMSGAAIVDESLLSAEAGKVDLNTVDVETLTKVGAKFIDASTAAEIVAYRDQLSGQPFQSVMDLLNVPNAGVTIETIYGPADQIRPFDDAQFLAGDLADRVAARLNGQGVRGLADVVTVFSAEPLLQQNGATRLSLSTPWTDQLGLNLTNLCGEAAAALIKRAMERGVKFQSDGELIQALRESKLPFEEWPPILDALTTTNDEHRLGRVDINTAPLEVLMTLPTFTPEQAAQIINIRSSKTSDECATIAWPVLAKVISSEQLQQVADKITTRCWIYRVRLAAGEINVADDEVRETWAGAPMIVEAVIDLSASRIRLAYLRDISVLQAAVQIAVENVIDESTVFESTNASESAQFRGQNRAASDPVWRRISEPLSPPENKNPTGASPQRIGRWTAGK